MSEENTYGGWRAQTHKNENSGAFMEHNVRYWYRKSFLGGERFLGELATVNVLRSVTVEGVWGL